MKWALPPKIKVYEAFGCIADKRIVVKGNEAKVASSSKGKKYSVIYDPAKNAIMANDNGSYWAGYLGYPSIAFLMLKGVLEYDQKFAETLKGIPWKDVNVKFKNDFGKTEKYVLGLVTKKGCDGNMLVAEVDRIYEQIKALDVEKLGKRIKPPEGY